VDGLTVGTTSIVGKPDDLSEALDSNLKFTTTGADSWHVASGQSSQYYYDGDSAQSGTTSSGEESCLETIVDSDNPETLKFYWKVSCQADVDYLEFYIDGVRQSPRITGETDWVLQSYSLSAGIHTLKWRFINGGGSSGQECGWVDFVQWTGPSPKQDPSNWQQIDYKQDVTGRRVEKKVDGYSTRYVYDGDDVIAEYDGNNNLLRKYIYGPCTDEPVCMIEVADSNTYYYHYDALGSVVALSDSSGSTVETYEYSVYGEAAASDANNPNPYMFAGRRFDVEIGLYYNRARYYNPYTGRFLQVDPVGYDAGMNMYRYCQNNPVNFADPSGRDSSSYDDATGADDNDSNDRDEPNTNITYRTTVVAAWAIWEERPWSHWGPWYGLTLPFPLPDIEVPGLAKTLKWRTRNQHRDLVWYREFKTEAIDEATGEVVSITYNVVREGVIKSEYRIQMQHQTVYHYVGRVWFEGELITSSPGPWQDCTHGGSW
jgi:RHS repeat-associated protein